jgi:hydrogenase expression/formation protein HypC
MCLAIPAEITEISTERPELATVAVAGVRRVINTSLVDDPLPGDWVLVHVGFAMSKIDEKEAALTLSYLAGMEQAYADELRALTESSIE